MSVDRGSDDDLDLLALTLIPGFGPILIGRAIRTLGSPAAVLAADASRLASVKGLGPSRAAALAAARNEARARARKEREAARALGARIVSMLDPEYPPLLAEIPDPPPVLYVRGEIRPQEHDRYAVAVVGSRRASQYGLEQSDRFALALAQAGLTVVSGGARGIDTAAHRAAMRAGGRTLVVMGCGLAHVYPEENAPLFDQVASGRGAVLSELPLHAEPRAENFPARNRIISGLSLGVLVIEAAAGSGALITARLAAEEHSRDVFALPGRVDSPHCEGSLALLKQGGALLVTHPADLVESLESPARHAHGGTHEARYSRPAEAHEPALARQTDSASFVASDAQPEPVSSRSATQATILEALRQPLAVDELAQLTSLPIAAIRAELTLLEIRKLIKRDGEKYRGVSANRANKAP
ncbi:MAG: DNA-protecting protein DprA [Phycisphaerae bacterium]|nr:DNA-protecting protein DprA [Phycisphaerae bacterium]